MIGDLFQRKARTKSVDFWSFYPSRGMHCHRKIEKKRRPSKSGRAANCLFVIIDNTLIKYLVFLRKNYCKFVSAIVIYIHTITGAHCAYCIMPQIVRGFVTCAKRASPVKYNERIGVKTWRRLKRRKSKQKNSPLMISS